MKISLYFTLYFSCEHWAIYPWHLRIALLFTFLECEHWARSLTCENRFDYNLGLLMKTLGHIVDKCEWFWFLLWHWFMFRIFHVEFCYLDFTCHVFIFILFFTFIYHVLFSNNNCFFFFSFFFLSSVFVCLF